MNPIIVIVGPPAVGKSTTSWAVAAHFSNGIHIPVDDIRDMVVSGRVLPGPTWDERLVQQLALARKSVVHMALTYHRAGFAVVIDDFVDPHNLADYEPLFAHPSIQKIVLYPSQQEARRRNFQRSGDTPDRAYIDEGIRIVYRPSSPARDGVRTCCTTHRSYRAAPNFRHVDTRPVERLVRRSRQCRVQRRMLRNSH